MVSASAQLGCGGILASAVAVGRVHRGWAALCCEQGPSAGPPLGLLSASASRLLTDRDRTRFCCPRLRPHGHADSWAHAGPRVFLGAGVPLDKPGPRLSSFAPVPGPGTAGSVQGGQQLPACAVGERPAQPCLPPECSVLHPLPRRPRGGLRCLALDRPRPQDPGETVSCASDCVPAPGLRGHGAPPCHLRDVHGCHVPGPSVSGVLELS